MRHTQFCHVCPSCLIVQFLTYLATYIRRFNALHAIVHNIRHDIHIVYIKDSLFLSFRQHLPEQLCFRPVKILPHRLHSPYITEKPARKVPFLNTTILIESRCVSISRSIFVSGAISCSATFSIAPTASLTPTPPLPYKCLLCS